MKLFLDTNVLIDFLLEREPFYMPAAALLSFAEEQRVEFIVSSLSIVNANFICCERAKMSLATWKYKINGLKDLIKICPINSDDIYNACNSLWPDFEDSVQFFAALQCKADGIVTRNTKDFVLSELPVMTPDLAIDRISIS